MFSDITLYWLHCIDCTPSVLWRCWLACKKTEWWDVGVVIWDEMQTCIWPSRCHCHSLSLAPVNPDWIYLPGFYLSGTCSPGWSRTNCRRAVKRLYVCMYDCTEKMCCICKRKLVNDWQNQEGNKTIFRAAKHTAQDGHEVLSTDRVTAFSGCGLLDLNNRERWESARS